MASRKQCSSARVRTALGKEGAKAARRKRK